MRNVNMRTLAIAITVTALIAMVLGLVVMAAATAGVERDAFRAEAIAQGLAEYDVFTGEWQWRGGMRPPLSDYPEWRWCPVCDGEGVLPEVDLTIPDTKAKEIPSGEKVVEPKKESWM